MKKLLLLIFLATLAILLVSCDHTHEKAEKRMSDATHHWYPCAHKDCTATLEKVEHVWGKGEITTPPFPSKDGVRSYLCTVCQHLKQESVKYESVFVVDEQRWKMAFSSSEFANFTAVVEEIRRSEDSEHKTTYTVQADGSVIYVVTTVKVNGEEISYEGKLQDGNLVWKFINRDQKLEDVELELSPELMQSYAVLTDNGFDRLLDSFNSFSFNVETGCYEAENLNFEKGAFGYSNVSVKIQDGRIASINAVTDEAQPTEIKIVCTDYGKTKPNPPMAEQSK